MFGFLNRTPHLPEGFAAALEGAYSDDEMQQLDRFGTTLNLEAGTTLATEGHTGREVFLIVSGEADVLRDDVVIATVGPGTVVGESAVLTNEPRNATLIATNDVQVVVFSRRDFNSLLAASPQLELRMQELADARADG